MSQKHALWRYLKRLRNAENILKTWTLTHGLWHYLKLQWEKQYIFWFNQSRSEVCQPSPGNVKIRTVFEAIFRNSENLKAMNLNGAFFRYFIRYLTCREKIESKESKWCILTLFLYLCSTIFRQRTRPWIRLCNL